MRNNDAIPAHEAQAIAAWSVRNSRSIKGLDTRRIASLIVLLTQFPTQFRCVGPAISAAFMPLRAEFKAQQHGWSMHA